MYKHKTLIFPEVTKDAPLFYEHLNLPAFGKLIPK